MYMRLHIISRVYQGESIAKASRYIHKSRKAGNDMMKRFRRIIHKILQLWSKSKLTNEQLAELKGIIISDVQKLIKEHYGVDYSYKSVWKFVREKLGLVYVKYSKDLVEKLNNSKKF